MEPMEEQELFLQDGKFQVTKFLLLSRKYYRQFSP